MPTWCERERGRGSGIGARHRVSLWRRRPVDKLRELVVARREASRPFHADKNAVASRGSSRVRGEGETLQ